MPGDNGYLYWKSAAGWNRGDFQNVAVHLGRAGEHVVINFRAGVATRAKFYQFSANRLIGNFRESDMLFPAAGISPRDRHLRLLNRRFVLIIAGMGGGKHEFERRLPSPMPVLSKRMANVSGPSFTNGPQIRSMEIGPPPEACPMGESALSPDQVAGRGLPPGTVS